MPTLPKPYNPQSQAGFTLIEFMIVTTLGIFLMLTASSVFLTIMVGRAKTATQQRLKAEGDYAMGQIEFLLRNAVALKPTVSNPAVTCTQSSDTNEVVLQSMDGKITRITVQSNSAPTPNKIMSVSDGQTTILTSSAVNLTSGPNFRCIDNPSAGNRYFNIQFTLSKNNLEQTFSSSVNMRNY